MPVFIEYPGELSPQDRSDLQKIYTDLPDTLLLPYSDRQSLIQQAVQHNSLVVARFNDRLLGAALLQREGTQWRLSHLCVREITRRRGVAKRLLEQVKQQAVQQQARLILDIPPHLEPLQQWAKHNNYLP